MDNINQKLYKAAIIGCGRMSRGHAGAFGRLGMPVTAVADISEEALNRAVSDYHAEKGYTDYRALLREIRPDIVAIVTPDALHCEMVEEAARAGVRGIVCEKPMAMDLGEARRMLSACRAAGSVLTVSHQRYYMPQYAYARELLREGAAGRLISAEAFGFAGSIMTDGTHTIHMAMSLLGDPVPVHLIGMVDGNSDYRYFGHRCDHAGHVFVAFADKTFMQLTWGGMNPSAPLKDRLHPLWDSGKYGYHAFTVHGELGSLTLSGDISVVRSEGNETLRLPEIGLTGGAAGVTAGRIRIPWPDQAGRSPSEYAGDLSRQAIADEIADLIQAMETGTDHPLSGENGYRVLEVIMGIYESTRRRGVVRFPVEASDNPFLAMCDNVVFPQ